MQLVTHVPVIINNRITSHSRLSEIVQVFESPSVKTETTTTKQTKRPRISWTKYHVARMKSAPKYAQSPDMDLTLREILTHERVTDKIAATLFVYTVGVFLIFFLLNS